MFEERAFIKAWIDAFPVHYQSGKAIVVTTSVVPSSSSKTTSEVIVNLIRLIWKTP
jgi:hypothetical protein